MDTAKIDGNLTVDTFDIDEGSAFDVSLSTPLSTLLATSDLESLGNLTGSLSLTKRGDDIYITGSADGLVICECGRCLKKYEHKVTLEIGAVFFQDMKEDEEEGEAYSYSGDTINLTGFLREQFFLALPIKKVCDEECKGLCPNCGINLNENKCGCVVKGIDHRLAILKNLKK